MKFYSVDLRQKIINVYETEPISQRQLAQRFCVALSFVQKLLKQYRQPKIFLLKLIDGSVNLNLPRSNW